MSKLRLRTTPTKSSLLRLKRQLRFLHNGHALLERKRELLTRLVYERLGEFKQRRAAAQESLKQAYYWLSLAQLRMGGRSMHQASLGISPAVEISILPRRALGIQYPAVQAQLLPLQPVGLLGIDPSFDEARKCFAEATQKLAILAEAEMALCRLISEQRKAQKRVNALKYNIIPAYDQAIRRIKDLLEEEERATLFAIKRLNEHGKSL
ncbi:MAG: V-type ATP synthase subunit D [Gammaproteobacteria bacterium SHHR-1]|uniref:V-type ATP synthase subunit D n=1 Tax=Magnetovirga frankeli TaxID=947516 RepID=UPI001293A7A1|nr:V-type ATP synthase subunit D [gamma proteobacterium SS-5]